MHYVLVISSLTSGGAERILSQLANHWVERGHRISLILFKNNEIFYPLDSRVELIYLPSEPVAWLKLAYLPIKAFFLRYYIQKKQPHVVLSFLDKVNVITLLMTLGMLTPIVVSERVDPHHHNIGCIFNILRKIFYMRAKRVVVQTQSIADYFKIPTIIIPNFVLPTEHKAEICNEVCTIITVGRLDEQKDQKTLIQAFSKLVQNGHTSIRLDIYGQGPLKNALEKLIYELSMDSYIFLQGAVPDVHDKLRSSDLFVFPSLYEGFPNALCEALAAGVPCVASNVSGNKDVIVDGINGRLFEVGNIQALVDIMQELIDSIEIRQQLTASGPKSMEDYIPENIYPIWDRMMEEIFYANNKI